MSDPNVRGRTRFIVLFQGRAGSSYLMDALGRVPDVIAEGEMLVGVARPGGSILNRLRWVMRPAADWLIRPLAEDGPAGLQMQKVRHFYEAPWEGARAVGFKTKLRDVYDSEAFGLLLGELGVRAIVLERQNLVKQAVSHLNALRLYERRGEWNLRDERARPEPFEVDGEAFDDLLRRLAFGRDVLASFASYLRTPTLRLEYDDLVRDPTAWFGAACRFLGLRPREPRSDMKKTSDDDLRTLVLNFDEIRSRYEGTAYESLFDERV